MNESKHDGGNEERLLESVLIETLRQRQASGHATRLRDLHALLEVPQPLALRIARRLEEAGTLVVRQDALDRLASEISVVAPVAGFLEHFMKASSTRK